MTSLRKHKDSERPEENPHKLLKVSTFSDAKVESRTNTAKLLWLFKQSNIATSAAPRKETFIDTSDGDSEMTSSSDEKKGEDAKNQYEVFSNHQSFQSISLNKPEVAKHNIQGILALDIDGTLKNKNGYINEKEIKLIIQKAIENGFLVVAVTFRNFENDKKKEAKLTAVNIINGLNSGISRIYYTNHQRKSVVLEHLRQEYGLRKDQIAILDDQYKAIKNCFKKSFISVPMNKSSPTTCLQHLRNFVMKRPLIGDKLFESYRDEFLKENKTKKKKKVKSKLTKMAVKV